MALPISYNIRNVRVRWQVTLLAISGIALVVAVFAILLSMSAGFQMALRATGRPDNALIVQRGSASELTSGVGISVRNMIIADDRIARRPDGSPMAAWDWVVVMSLPKVENQGSTNVTLRAVTPQAFEVRGGIEIKEGRNFTPGLDEVIVGRKIMGRIEGLNLGQRLKYMDKSFVVVGVFESSGGAFESEIWGDYDIMGALFQRGAGSNSLTVRMKDASQIGALDKWIRSQPNMQLQAVPENKYYEDQAGPLAAILKGLAGFVAFVMGVGAVFGAMNTMYAIVASRTREIGTLRALGFSRFSILSSFVMESIVLALLAGAIGCLIALPMNGYSTGTAQTQSFSEVAFSFQLTPQILLTGMIFAGVMGLIGGLLPAVRAARMPITRALRDA
jgi:putative ABC transport system permease protein